MDEIIINNVILSEPVRRKKADKKEALLSLLMWPLAYVYSDLFYEVCFADSIKTKVLFAIFVLGFIALGEALMYKRERSAESFIFLALTLMSASAYVFSIGQVWDEFSKVFFTHLFAVYWLLCRSGHLAERNTSHFFVLDGCMAFFYMPFKNFAVNCLNLADGVNLIKSRNEEKGKDLKAVVASIIAISLGLVLLVAAVLVLGAADENFSYIFERLNQIIDINLDSSFIFKLIIMLPVCLYISGYMLGLYRDSDEEHAARTRNYYTFLAKIQKVPAAVWIAFIAIFSVIYVIFFALQGSYFLDAFSLNLPNTFSYSSYARRGFAEMCVVMLINISLWWLASRSCEKESRLLKAANTVLLIESMLFAVIAFLKLYMYIDAYGFTPLRLQSIWLVCVLFYACICILLSSYKIKTARAWFVGSAVSLAVLCLI